MTLATVNIGNTNINIGVFDSARLVDNFRVKVNDFPQNAVFSDKLANYLTESKIENFVLASVNPEAENAFSKWLKAEHGRATIKIGKDISPRMPIKTQNPEKVGADRIANSTAAYEVVKDCVITVDMGTAITFDVVSKTGEYIGGAISPGLMMCANALHAQTSRLPAIVPQYSKKIICNNTEEAMNAGVYWGCAGAIDLILKKIFTALDCKPVVIATGGDAELLAGATEYLDKVTPGLTLDGIRLIYEENRENR